MGTVSVSLASHRSDQYEEFMQPSNHPFVPFVLGSATEKTMGFGDVCSFICALVQQNIHVECTVVQRPGVDVKACRALSEELGAVSFKVRDYHP